MSAAPAAAIGVVLAGGGGRRLGGDKPGALLDGRPLISYPLAALRAALGEVAVVAKAGTALPSLGYGVLIWREPDEPQHPLAGIVEALRRADGRSVVVLACDMPFATAELVRSLASEDGGGAPALLARADGRLQPLCARYEPAALDALVGFDAQGSMTEQVAALSPATLDVDGALLGNVNRAEDLERAEARLNRT